MAFLVFLATLLARLAMGLAGAGLPVALASFRALVLTTALDTLRLGARRTALMASDLSRAERSVLANMASRGELQQVQVVHLDDINTGNVPESLGDALVLVVDDKGTQLLDVTAVPQLSLASAHAAGGVDL